jgi:hypothetical protein
VETADIQIGPPITRRARLVAQFGDVKDSNFSSETPIRRLSANAWLNETGDQEDFQTPVIGRAVIRGDFAADLTLTSLGAFSPTLGVLSVGGQIDGDWNIVGNTRYIAAAGSHESFHAVFTGNVGTYRLAGDMGGNLEANSIRALWVGGDAQAGELTLNQPVVPGRIRRTALGSAFVAGKVDGWTLRSAGHIGSFVAGAIHNSNLFAGVTPNTISLPTEAGQFASQARFGNLRILGLPDEPLSLVNSNIAAWTLGTVNLRFAQTSADAPIFGVAGNRVNVLTYTDDTGLDYYLRPQADQVLDQNLIFRKINPAV